jgi:DNA-binding SARP family transcriptional activator
VSEGCLLPLGTDRQRALLAVLLLHRNEPISSDRLVEELWPEQAPRTANKIVQGYVSKLRRALAERPGPSRLATRPGGYRLEVQPAECDLDRLESLLKRGSDALASGLARQAADILREALALRRGPALADFTYEPFAQAAIARVEELQLVTLEQRIEADLAVGGRADLVGELEALAAEHPLRERLRGQLMLALYRSGRQAEALGVYQSTRRALVEELGIEPGPGLQQLEKAILRQDTSLELPTLREREVERAGVPTAGSVTVVAPGEQVADTESEPVVPTEALERRKRVTVLFCGLVESTGLGKRPDPELLKQVVGCYFELVALVVGRHGASLEKFIGDAVMAVFGVPGAHEDDALRAVRAALEIRDGLPALNERLETEFGLTLALRIGVSSGEVLAGESMAGEALVTGEAVRLAARLEQCAGENQVLLGPTTWRLVRDAVQVEPTGPLKPQGTEETVNAFRLLGLLANAAPVAWHLEAPLVGRERELAQLRQAFARCSGERTCCLFTVLGVAGVGKSRLAAEIRLELVEEARVLVGRCLPYGEGITFWPLTEMVGQMEAKELERELGLGHMPGGDPDDEWIASSMAGLLGPRGASSDLAESLLAVRRWFERLATELPLLLVFEDVHWAEPTLLDLIEQLADLARDAPILILCLARHELLEQRPGWAGGKPNATTILLEQLDETESRHLVDWLLTDITLSDEARVRALRLAEGNPLFLEQLLVYASEEHWPEDDLPPTIEALLAARLDRLGPAERALAERAALIGRDFDLNALRDLAPEPLRPSINAHLTALVRKEVIRPSRSRQPAIERYRFRHLLIRDAAYRGMAKQLRADLHERHANWAQTSGALDEYADEITGYHLEQAYRYRLELRPLETAATRRLAQQASHRLARAGRRARERGDGQAAASLLERATALLPDGDHANASIASPPSVNRDDNYIREA